MICIVLRIFWMSCLFGNNCILYLINVPKINTIIHSSIFLYLFIAFDIFVGSCEEIIEFIMAQTASYKSQYIS